MFSPSRLLAFLKRFLRLALAGILVLLLLSVLAEVLTRLDALPSIWLDWTFWVAIPLNLLPAIVVSGLIFWLAGRYVQALYKLDSVKDGVGFLLRSRFGQSGFGPWMRVEKGTVTQNKECVLSSTGGPGHLIVYHDSAIVLEQAGRLTRIEGPGYVKLESFERIFGIVDLRPKRWVRTVNAMTKDGIPISWDAEIHYQVADNGQEPSEQSPFPLSKDAVFRAAIHNFAFVGKDIKMDWEARIIIGNTEGSLRTILARKYLNQIVGLTEQDAQDARREVQEELETVLHESVPPLGAKILAVKLANLQVQDEITQQWIEAWRARWQRWSTERIARGEAARIYALETAKAEAQMSLLVKMGKALEGLTQRDVVVPHIILNRLFSVLDGASFSASSRIFFPNQAMEALEKMRRIVQDGDPQAMQLLPGDPDQEQDA